MRTRKLFDAFSEVYQTQVSHRRNRATNEEAFYKANEAFQEQHGFQAYSSYDSYRSAVRRARVRERKQQQNI